MPNHITEIVVQDHQSIIDTPGEAAATIPPEFQEPYQPQLCWHWCQTKLQAVALSHAARRIQSIVNNNTLKIQRQLGQDMAAALGRAFDQFQQANQATNPTPKNIPHDQTSPEEQEIN